MLARLSVDIPSMGVPRGLSLVFLNASIPDIRIKSNPLPENRGLDGERLLPALDLACVRRDGKAHGIQAVLDFIV